MSLAGQNAEPSRMDKEIFDKTSCLDLGDYSCLKRAEIATVVASNRAQVLSKNPGIVVLSSAVWVS